MVPAWGLGSPRTQEAQKVHSVLRETEVQQEAQKVYLVLQETEVQQEAQEVHSVPQETELQVSWVDGHDVEAGPLVEAETGLRRQVSDGRWKSCLSRSPFAK